MNPVFFKISILLHCLPLFVNSQINHETLNQAYIKVDKKIESCPDTFKTFISLSNYLNQTFTNENEKARAIFYWVTKNIAYDPQLMYTLRINADKFVTCKEAFENRKGVCIGYALIIDTLFKLTNIPTFLIEGSTKQNFLPSISGHAYNAIKINNHWQLLDATWGAGYLNGNKFIRKRNNYYFLTPPEKLIKTHLPIDPIWQLLSKPINLYQFHAASASTQTSDWNYHDSITDFLNLDYIYQIKAQKRRLKKFGTDSEITSNYFLYFESVENNFYLTKFNKSLYKFNDGVEKFNDYIEFKNAQFTPIKSDSLISLIMPEIQKNLKAAELGLEGIYGNTKENEILQNTDNLLQKIRELRDKVDNETLFVNKYLSTKRNKRRDLFVTKTLYWFGIPIK